MSLPVALERLSFAYAEGGRSAVSEVTLEVAAGEVLAVVGPSGSGKSTLLRLVAGLLRPTGGSVRLGGEDVTGLSPERRRGGMVFQGYALFPHLSVFDNVAYGLRMRRVPRAEARERVSRALALVKLSQFADRRPKQLSGGQQQRVAIARALVIEPKVLLLDEPLSNLDAKLRQEMRVELRRLLRSTNVASIFVTHDQEEAMVLSDDIILMNAGEVEQQGSPREIYQQPRSLFAATFVGAANFLRGEVVEVTSDGVATISAEGTHLRGTACGELAARMPATLVVKHEHVALAPSGSEPANVVDCRFEIANFIGPSLQLHCTLGSQPLVGLIAASKRSISEPNPGSAIRLVFNEADTLVFPGHVQPS